MDANATRTRDDIVLDSLAEAEYQSGDHDVLQTVLSMALAFVVMTHWMIARHCQTSRKFASEGGVRYRRAEFLLSKEHDKMQLVLSVATVLLIFSALQLFEPTTYSGGFLLALCQFALLFTHLGFANGRSILSRADIQFATASPHTTASRGQYPSNADTHNDASSPSREERTSDAEGSSSSNNDIEAEHVTHPNILATRANERAFGLREHDGSRQDLLLFAVVVFVVCELFRPNTNDQAQNPAMMFRLASKLGMFGALISILGVTVLKQLCRPNSTYEGMSVCSRVGVFLLNLVALALHVASTYGNLLVLVESQDDGSSADSKTVDTWWSLWLPMLPFWGAFCQLLATSVVLRKQDLQNLSMCKRLKDSSISMQALSNDDCGTDSEATSLIQHGTGSTFTDGARRRTNTQPSLVYMY